MKELSIEEKARRYDEAIEIARQIHDADRVSGIELTTCEEIFPELAESEDEGIRIELLNYLWDAHDDDEERARWIAWLEKVGSIIKEWGDLKVRYIQDDLQEMVELKQKTEQGEQKPNPVLDIEIPFGAKDSELQEVSYYIPEGFHAEIECNRVVIKRGEQKPQRIVSAESKEAMYDKPAWSEEDEEMYKAISIALLFKDAKEYLDSWYKTPEEADNWFKSLKNRVQPKQEWSEEDSKKLHEVIHRLEHLDHFWNKPTDDNLINWLKSLRPQNRWKPSDEQIKILDMVLTNESMDDNVASILRELKEQLEAL